MRVDQTHRKWLVASIVILAAATGAYIPYAMHEAGGPNGGTVPGIIFGIVGFAFMLFAGLLGARKKIPIWRLGRAQAWMRGHLWLGVLSLPIIAFHAGFKFGGLLTTVLMILLIAVVASGLFGAALQHYMPTVMTAQVQAETIFEQIDHVREQLLAEADKLMAAAIGAKNAVAVAAGANASPSFSVELRSAGSEEISPLRNFYVLEMRPFLESNGRNELLSDPNQARAAFIGLRTLLPAEIHETTKSLEAICDEERQLRRQTILHHWLHGWLMLHVPLSLALLLLGAVHAVVALRY
jgi:hypothetical protein